LGTDAKLTVTDGDGERLERGRMGMDYNSAVTDGDGDKCLVPCRALLQTVLSRLFNRMVDLVVLLIAGHLEILM
jgi:hypothetical protein